MGSIVSVAVFPDEVQGWRPRGKDNTFDRETVFRYMNGAGETYRAFAFRELTVRSYAKAAPTS